MSERPDQDDAADNGFDPTRTESEIPIEVPEAASRPLDDSPEDHIDVASDESSEEHVGPRFETQKLDPDDISFQSQLGDAYDCLQLRTPAEEFETYARARLETLVRLGEADRAQLASEALEAGLGALRLVMGGASAPQELSQ